MSLSERLRPNCEAAPWVVEEVRLLEQHNKQLQADLDVFVGMSKSHNDTVSALQKKVVLLSAQIARMRQRAGNACYPGLPLSGVQNALKDIERGCPESDSERTWRNQQQAKEILDKAKDPEGQSMGVPRASLDEGSAGLISETDALLIAHMKKNESNLARAYIALQAEAEALRCGYARQGASLQEAQAKVEKLLAGEMQRGFEHGEKITLRQEVAGLRHELAEAARIIREAKSRWAPTTTNSDADVWLATYGRRGGDDGR